MGDAIMAVSYNKLWKLLVDKRLKKNSRGIQSIKDITKRPSDGGHLKLNM